jgi:hypothetical protein
MGMSLQRLGERRRDLLARFTQPPRRVRRRSRVDGEAGAPEGCDDHAGRGGPPGRDLASRRAADKRRARGLARDRRQHLRQVVGVRAKDHQQLRIGPDQRGRGGRRAGREGVGLDRVADRGPTPRRLRIAGLRGKGSKFAHTSLIGGVGPATYRVNRGRATPLTSSDRMMRMRTVIRSACSRSTGRPTPGRRRGRTVVT